MAPGETFRLDVTGCSAPSLTGLGCTNLKAMNDDPTVLLTAQGQELLARLAAELDSGGLALAVRLRREYPADLVATATAQHELRLAARAKFSRAADMLFTRSGYEQSSAEPIARYRAARFGDARQVADLCCGIGGDLLALAPGRRRSRLTWTRSTQGWPCTTPRVRGSGNVRAVVDDVRDLRLVGLDAVFIDPARRSGPGTASADRGGAAHPAARAAIPGRAVRAAARLVLRPRRPGARRLRQGRSRPAPRPAPGGMGGRVHRRRP